MKKLNRIAVFLCGHLRTWNYTKDNFFSAMDSFSDNVDYYVAFWNTSHGYAYDVRKDFADKNLIEYLVVDGHFNYNSWNGHVHLSNLLEPSKFKKELSSNVYPHYDLVIETRPDVVIDIVGEPNWPVDNELMVDCEVSYEQEESGFHGVSDLLFATSSRNHVIMNQRIKYTPEVETSRPILHGNHSKILHYCEINQIKIIGSLKWLNVQLVRPNIELLPFDGKGLYTDHAFKLFNLWGNYTFKEKADHLRASNIPIEDYASSMIFPKPSQLT
jgi:hypothetical protein